MSTSDAARSVRARACTARRTIWRRSRSPGCDPTASRPDDQGPSRPALPARPRGHRARVRPLHAVPVGDGARGAREQEPLDGRLAADELRPLRPERRAHAAERRRGHRRRGDDAPTPFGPWAVKLWPEWTSADARAGARLVSPAPLRVGLDLDGSLESLGNSMTDLANALDADGRVRARAVPLPVGARPRERGAPRAAPALGAAVAAQPRALRRPILGRGQTWSTWPGRATPPTRTAPLIISVDDLRPLRGESREHQRVAQLRRAVAATGAYAGRLDAQRQPRGPARARRRPQPRSSSCRRPCRWSSRRVDGDALVVNLTGRRGAVPRAGARRSSSSLGATVPTSRRVASAKVGPAHPRERRRRAAAPARRGATGARRARAWSAHLRRRALSRPSRSPRSRRACRRSRARRRSTASSSRARRR